MLELLQSLFHSCCISTNDISGELGKKKRVCLTYLSHLHPQSWCCCCQMIPMKCTEKIPHYYICIYRYLSMCMCVYVYFYRLVYIFKNEKRNSDLYPHTQMHAGTHTDTHTRRLRHQTQLCEHHGFAKNKEQIQLHV